MLPNINKELKISKINISYFFMAFDYWMGKWKEDPSEFFFVCN
jgi:hypothetical protein